jgi:hypothetical protein
MKKKVAVRRMTFAVRMSHWGWRRDAWRAMVRLLEDMEDTI